MAIKILCRRQRSLCWNIWELVSLSVGSSLFDSHNFRREEINPWVVKVSGSYNKKFKAWSDARDAYNVHLRAGNCEVLE